MQNIDTNFENIKLLNRVRLVAILGQVSLILVATLFLEILLPLPRLFMLITFEVLFQLISWHRLKQTNNISATEVLIHIFFDSLILAGLIYFSGGANNPFIYLLLLPIALGTIMLRLHELIILALVQVGLYSLLNIYQRPFELGDSSPLASFHLHLLGMWVNFALTVFLIVVFGFLARQSLLKKEKQIRQLRELQMKDEQVLSLGIMSANAAHQLGTPLSTMAVVIDDIQHDSENSELSTDLKIIESQIHRCRNIIDELGEKSRDLKTNLEKSQLNDNNETLKSQLAEIFDRWLVFRPQIQLTQQWQSATEKLRYSLSVSVEQALTNLLDNAADASLANDENQVEFVVEVNNTHLILKINDQGKGLSPEQLQSAGNQIQESAKSEGLGWGLLLSNASLERAGGSVYINRNKSGGTSTQILLPLAPSTQSEAASSVGR